MDHPERESPLDAGLVDVYRDGMLVPPGPDERPRSPHHEPPAGLAPGELRRFQALVEEERAVSKQRQRLHERIDFVRSQASGSEATDGDLAYLTQRERDVSDRRRELHSLIDAILQETGGRSTTAAWSDDPRPQGSEAPVDA